MEEKPKSDLHSDIDLERMGREQLEDKYFELNFSLERLSDFLEKTRSDEDHLGRGTTHVSDEFRNNLKKEIELTEQELAICMNEYKTNNLEIPKEPRPRPFN